jgi:hypothetical protein
MAIVYGPVSGYGATVADLAVKAGQAQAAKQQAEITQKIQAQKELQQMEIDFQRSMKLLDYQMELKKIAEAKQWEIDKMKLASQLDFEAEERQRIQKQQELDARIRAIDECDYLTPEQKSKLKAAVQLEFIGAKEAAQSIVNPKKTDLSTLFDLTGHNFSDQTKDSTVPTVVIGKYTYQLDEKTGDLKPVIQKPASQPVQEEGYFSNYGAKLRNVIDYLGTSLGFTPSEQDEEMVQSIENLFTQPMTNLAGAHTTVGEEISNINLFLDSAENSNASHSDEIIKILRKRINQIPATSAAIQQEVNQLNVKLDAMQQRQKFNQYVEEAIEQQRKRWQATQPKQLRQGRYVTWQPNIELAKERAMQRLNSEKKPIITDTIYGGMW